MKLVSFLEEEHFYLRNGLGVLILLSEKQVDAVENVIYSGLLEFETGIDICEAGVKFENVCLDHEVDLLHKSYTCSFCGISFCSSSGITSHYERICYTRHLEEAVQTTSE